MFSRPALTLAFATSGLYACSALIDAPNATFERADAGDHGAADQRPDADQVSSAAPEYVVESAQSLAGDNFGTTIVLQDDELFVAAPTADLHGVSSDGESTCGDPIDAIDAGRVYAFARHGDAWREADAIQRASAESGEGQVNVALFVFLPRMSIACSGDTLAIGVPGAYFSDCERGSASASAAHDEVKQAGKVFVYERDDLGQWSASAVLTASEPAAGDYFGANLALRDDELFVSAAGDSAPTAESPQTDTVEASGSVYVFVREGAAWRAAQRITPNNPFPGAFFGSALSIDGDTLAVGAWLDGHGERGVNPEPLTLQAAMSGAAYVFRERGGLWQQEAYIKAFNADSSDGFGIAVALEQDTLLVGAPGEHGGHRSTDLRQIDPSSIDDNAIDGAGAVYAYERSGSDWSPVAYLKTFEPLANTAFGVAVSMHNGRVLIGAPYQPGPLTSGRAAGLSMVGAAYLFENKSGELVPRTAYRPVNPHGMELFGYSTALGDDVAAIGAPDNFMGPGRVSVFQVDPPSDTDE